MLLNVFYSSFYFYGEWFFGRFWSGSVKSVRGVLGVSFLKDDFLPGGFRLFFSDEYDLVVVGGEVIINRVIHGANVRNRSVTGSLLLFCLSGMRGRCERIAGPFLLRSRCM